MDFNNFVNIDRTTDLKANDNINNYIQLIAKLFMQKTY